MRSYFIDIILLIILLFSWKTYDYFKDKTDELEDSLNESIRFYDLYEEKLNQEIKAKSDSIQLLKIFLASPSRDEET